MVGNSASTSELKEQGGYKGPPLKDTKGDTSAPFYYFCIYREVLISYIYLISYIFHAHWPSEGRRGRVLMGFLNVLNHLCLKLLLQYSAT